MILLVLFLLLTGCASSVPTPPTNAPGEFSVSWDAGDASDGMLDEGDVLVAHYRLAEGIVSPGRVVPIHFGMDGVLDATVRMPPRA
jgi:hypothetical protein